jgi:hypothetical protein
MQYLRRCVQQGSAQSSTKSQLSRSSSSLPETGKKKECVNDELLNVCSPPRQLHFGVSARDNIPGLLLDDYTDLRIRFGRSSSNKRRYGELNC